ncbi:MAG: DinB family protein [Bacillota bacterium]
MLDVISADVAPALSAPLGQVETAFRRLTHLVKDMSQDALDYRGPSGNQNSTAMLIMHLAQVDLTYLHTITGEPVSAELESLYGPYHDENGHIPLVTGVSATDLLSHYRRVIDMVADYLKTKSDDEASRSVTIPWWEQPATVRYVLWHIASHSMFHQGQITRLKALYSEQYGA